MKTLPESKSDIQHAESAQLPYMVQLDALRALAVFAVMYFHYVPGHQTFFHWGDWGVRLFFVLSGFLITGILLKCRDLKQSEGQRVHPLKQFYIRRGLRIFPLFYAVVLLTALVDVKPAREALWWNLTYTSNLYFALKGSWGGPMSHFWSLAVEEQFYLFWPFFIFYLPRKYLTFFIIGAILFTPLYQIFGFAAGLNNKMLSITMMGSLIYLSMGGILAIFRLDSPKKYRDLISQSSYNWFGVILLCFMIGTSLIPIYLIKIVLNGVTSALFFAWLIHKASLGFRGPLGKLLEWKPLLYIGSISYGIYVYHNFMPVLAPRVLKVLYVSTQSNTINVLTALVLTLIVSALSWTLFERPINNLKRNFNYSKE